jgi:HEPN domain-containing protein
VPIAKVNRDILRSLANARIEEARILLDNGQWTGSYYMAGLGVECALKSCLAAAVKEYDFPDKDFVNAMYVHNLERLLRLNGGLWNSLQPDMKADVKLETNWNTVKDWDDSRRYVIVEELEARALYAATTEIPSGMMVWIKGKW